MGDFPELAGGQLPWCKEGGYFLHWLTKYGHREVSEIPKRS